MAIIRLEIEKCNKCPFCYIDQTPTCDSFEVAHDYYCTIKKEKIAGYVEHYSELPEVPEWCPIKE